MFAPLSLVGTLASRPSLTHWVSVSRSLVFRNHEITSPNTCFNNQNEKNELHHSFPIPDIAFNLENGQNCWTGCCPTWIPRFKARRVTLKFSTLSMRFFFCTHPRDCSRPNNEQVCAARTRHEGNRKNSNKPLLLSLTCEKNPKQILSSHTFG